MHYYNRNLGDYAKKAGRLSMLQHGAYTLLLDACYDREQFPTLAEAIDWTWASSTAEIEAVEFVLRKFFTLEGDRYVQKRIEEEVANYRAKSATNARIAQEREAKRKENSTKRERVVNEAPAKQHEAPPNQEPRTKNQEPKEEGRAPRKRAAAPLAIGKPDDVDQQTWGDWTALRTKKRATVSVTVVEEARRECAKAGLSLERFLQIWCMRGSQGLQADWLKPEERAAAQAPGQYETAYQRSMRERIEEAAPSIARRAPAQQQDATDYFRTVDVPARDVTRHAIEVQP